MRLAVLRGQGQDLADVPVRVVVVDHHALPPLTCGFTVRIAIWGTFGVRTLKSSSCVGTLGYEDHQERR